MGAAQRRIHRIVEHGLVGPQHARLRYHATTRSPLIIGARKANARRFSGMTVRRYWPHDAAAKDSEAGRNSPNPTAPKGQDMQAQDPTPGTATAAPLVTPPAPDARAHHHLARAVRLSPSEIRRAVKDVQGFNAKLAVVITKSVGSMLCAYLFSLIALTSLPAILIQAGVLTNSDVPSFLTKPGLILIVAWIAQTFIQLVLLSIIMVGQDVQSIASDARAENTFKDAQAILDALNTETQGGLRTVLEAIEAQNQTAAKPAPGVAG
jgi:hypothetical protein